MTPEARQAEAPGIRWSGRERQYLLVFMAGWLDGHAVIPGAVEIDWTGEASLMIRLKVGVMTVGFDFCWRYPCPECGGATDESGRPCLGCAAYREHQA